MISKNITSKKQYSKASRNLTKNNMTRYGCRKFGCEWRKLKVDYGVTIDHSLSVSDGWDKNVPVKIIASLSNLELMKYSDNFRKADNSSISRNKLWLSYNRVGNFDRKWHWEKVWQKIRTNFFIFRLKVFKKKIK